MAGRIRTIKPELLEDAVTAGLSDMAFRLFVASILLADDYGNLRFEPGWLKGQVYWARDVDLDAFAGAVEELVVAREGSAEPLITAYVVKGQRYGAIRGWDKHQKVQKPGRPRVPANPGEKGDIGALPESGQTLSGEPPESLRTDLRSPISDQDPEREPARGRAETHTQGFADAPGIETGPRIELDASLDTPIPAPWRLRAEAIVARTGVDFDLPSTWAKYRAACMDGRRRLTEPGWVVWAENEARFTAARNGKLDGLSWGKLRASRLESGAPPYHGGSNNVLRQRELEEREASRPENRALTLEASRAFAAGNFAPPKKAAP